MTLVYVAALFALCYALLVMEFFIPSGGVLGVVAAVAGLTSVVIAFTHNLNAGLWTVALYLVSTPVVMASLVRLWPRTSMGQLMLNRRPGQLDPGGTPRTTPRGTPLASLVGRVGVARSNLLPSGTIEIAGEKLDAVSEGMAIDRGEAVFVTRLLGNRIHVRPASDRERDGDETPRNPGSPASLETWDLEELG